MLALSDTCTAAMTGKGGLCGCLSSSSLGHLRAVAGDVRLETGAVLFHGGDAADAIFGVRQGTLMMSRRLGRHRRQVLSFHFSGDMVGFAEDGRHQAEAVALERVSLCRIPLSQLDEDRALQGHVLGIARRNLMQCLDLQMRLGRMNAAERVAALLAELYTRLGGGEALHLPMRVVDMADYLGLRPETVSREISALRHAGIVGAFTEGVLTVHDGQRLCRP